MAYTNTAESRLENSAQVLNCLFVDRATESVTIYGANGFN